MKNLKEHRTFGGTLSVFEHDSVTTKTPMKYSVYIPTGAKIRGALLWLSGLECNEETFQIKAGAQRYLSQAGLAVICPDTSPRGLDLPGEHDSWDFGSAASFYVDATTAGYRDHYRMYTYLTEELYEIISSQYSNNISIFGHSMGGHGALVLGLRQPKKFKAISAFAPIANPMQCPWGLKAFTGYLGDDQNSWKPYDATELIRSGARHDKPLFIDQGTKDKFLAEQLLTPNFEKALEGSSQKSKIRMQEGYDHSYYFISTFVEDHIRFHVEHLT